MGKQIKIIGVGMDGHAALTAAANSALTAAEVIIGARRVIDMLAITGKPTFESYKQDEIAEYIFGCGYENIAVAMSGDTGFYSGADGLADRLSRYDVEIIPGISSPSYFLAKLRLPWQNAKFISLHGKTANIARGVRANKLTFFLLGGSITAAAVCARLCEYGMENVKIRIGENLAMENERILTGKAADFVNEKTDNLCVLLVENPDYEHGVRKSEIRAVCVSKLGIGQTDICWDIGCGTGSVSVEMALRCSDGTVYAIDKSDEAVRLTDENRKKFGCDNIEILHSDAALAISSLPAPDRVFIGGSGGEIGEVINAAFRKNPRVQIAAPAISLETLEQCRAAFGSLGLPCDIIQIAVTRTKKIGDHTMMDAQNPIFIIQGGRR